MKLSTQFISALFAATLCHGMLSESQEKRLRDGATIEELKQEQEEAVRSKKLSEELKQKEEEAVSVKELSRRFLSSPALTPKTITKIHTIESVNVAERKQELLQLFAEQNKVGGIEAMPATHRQLRREAFLREKIASLDEQAKQLSEDIVETSAQLEKKEAALKLVKDMNIPETNITPKVEEPASFYDYCANGYNRVSSLFYSTPVAVYDPTDISRIPSMIPVYLKWVREHGIGMKGIFRVSPSMNNPFLKQQQEIIACNGKVELDADSDPMVIAYLIKSYFGKLSRPIFSAELTNVLIKHDFDEITNDSLKLTIWNEVLIDLQPQIRNLITDLFVTFQEVVNHVDVTMMGASNLSMTITPGLFTFSGSSLDAMGQQMAVGHWCSYLIENIQHLHPKVGKEPIQAEMCFEKEPEVIVEAAYVEPISTATFVKQAEVLKQLDNECQMLQAKVESLETQYEELDTQYQVVDKALRVNRPPRS